MATLADYLTALRTAVARGTNGFQPRRPFSRPSADVLASIDSGIVRDPVDGDSVLGLAHVPELLEGLDLRLPERPGFAALVPARLPAASASAYFGSQGSPLWKLFGQKDEHAFAELMRDTDISPVVRQAALTLVPPDVFTEPLRTRLHEDYGRITAELRDRTSRPGVRQRVSGRTAVLQDLATRLAGMLLTGHLGYAANQLHGVADSPDAARQAAEVLSQLYAHLRHSTTWCLNVLAPAHRTPLRSMRSSQALAAQRSLTDVPGSTDQKTTEGTDPPGQAGRPGPADRRRPPEPGAPTLGPGGP